VGAKWGPRTCPRRRGFFSRQYQTTFRKLRNGRFSPNLPMIRESWLNRRFWTEIYEKSFHSGVICPQNPNLEGVKQAPHSEQATGQGMHCRETLFTPRCSTRARVLPSLVNFFVQRTVAELRGFKVAKFSDFGLFSPYKTLKKYFPMTSLQPRGYIAE